MSNQKGQPIPVLRGQTTIYDLLTDSAIDGKGRQNIYLLPQEVRRVAKMMRSTNGKMCRVCDESYAHKDKCTNKQLPLEGSNNLALNTRKRAGDETSN